MDIKVEQGPGFPPCFVDYEVVEGVMLEELPLAYNWQRVNWSYMGYNKIFLFVGAY